MRKQYKIIMYFMLLLTFLIYGDYKDTAASLQLTPSYESEEDFLAWYEQHKEEGGTYTLQSDLLLSAGTEDTPIILDGGGEIKINCGNSAIVVNCPVILDNPNLSICGTGSTAICVTAQGGAITLLRGTVMSEDRDGNSSADAPMSVIGSLGGDIRTQENDSDFYVIASASNAVAVNISNREQPPIYGLTVTVEGQRTWGIKSFDGLHAIDCEIESNGSRNAYGIWTRGDILLERSSVYLNSEPTGSSYPLYSVKGSIVVKDSDVPGWENEGNYQYLVEEIYQGEPIPVRIHTPAEEIILPKQAETRLLDTETDISAFKIFPVTWEKDSLVTDKRGVYQVAGRLNENSLMRASASNAKDVRPTHTVVVLGEEGNFITEVRTKKVGSSTRIWAWAPYPYGADELFINYSTDGQHWFRITPKNGENMLQTYRPPYYGKQISFVASLPITEGKVFIRLEITGDTMYTGLGEPFELDLTHPGSHNNSEIDENAGGDRDHGSEGDRGGGGYHPSRPELPAAEGPAPDAALAAAGQTGQTGRIETAPQILPKETVAEKAYDPAAPDAKPNEEKNKAWNEEAEKEQKEIPLCQGDTLDQASLSAGSGKERETFMTKVKASAAPLCITVIVTGLLLLVSACAARYFTRNR